MSVKINVYNQQAEVVKTLELDAKVFAAKVKPEVIHQVFVAQTANERQVLAHTKTKAEVSGGGKKPWKQKGTGRARVGSSRSPLWRGGGIIFGPRSDRNFSVKINKKMKQLAMMGALSDKVTDGRLGLLDTLVIADVKTKKFDTILKKLEAKVFPKNRRSVLVVLDKGEEQTLLASRNLTNVEVISLENLNIFDVLKYKNLLLSEATALKLQTRYQK